MGSQYSLPAAAELPAPPAMRTLIAVLLVAIVAAEQRRNAEPSYGVQGYVGSSRQGYGYHRTAQGYGTNSYHPIQKRAADPGYPYAGHYGYGYPYAYGYGAPYYGYYGHGASYGYQTTVQHPGYGVSYQYNHGIVPAYYW